jgi:hypothetical protein
MFDVPDPLVVHVLFLRSEARSHVNLCITIFWLRQSSKLAKLLVDELSTGARYSTEWVSKAGNVSFQANTFCLFCYSMCGHTVDLTPLSKLSTHRNQYVDMVVRAKNKSLLWYHGRDRCRAHWRRTKNKQTCASARHCSESEWEVGLFGNRQYILFYWGYAYYSWHAEAYWSHESSK